MFQRLMTVIVTTRKVEVMCFVTRVLEYFPEKATLYNVRKSELKILFHSAYRNYNQSHHGFEPNIV